MSTVLLIMAWAVTAFVSLVIGSVIGMKFAYRCLEREGRLRPVTPPTVARTEE